MLSVSANPAKEEIRLRLFVINLQKICEKNKRHEKSLIPQSPKPLKNKASCLVEYRGFEPLTSTLPVWRAPNCANTPNMFFAVPGSPGFLRTLGL